jgi:hypothetical protein
MEKLIYPAYPHGHPGSEPFDFLRREFHRTLEVVTGWFSVQRTPHQVGNHSSDFDQ